MLPGPELSTPLVVTWTFEMHFIYGEGTNSGQQIIQFSPNSLIQTKHMNSLCFTYVVTNENKNLKKPNKQQKHKKLVIICLKTVLYPRKENY